MSHSPERNLLDSILRNSDSHSDSKNINGKPYDSFISHASKHSDSNTKREKKKNVLVERITSNAKLVTNAASHFLNQIFDYRLILSSFYLILFLCTLTRTGFGTLLKESLVPVDDSLSVNIFISPSSLTTQTSATFQFQVRLNASNCTACDVKCYLDDGLGIDCPSGKIEYQNLSEGFHYFRILVTLYPDLVFSDSFNWTIDFAPPTAEITVPSLRSNQNYSNVVVTFTEPCYNFECNSSSYCGIGIRGLAEIDYSSFKMDKNYTSYSFQVSFLSVRDRVRIYVEEDACVDNFNVSFVPTSTSSVTLRYDLRKLTLTLRSIIRPIPVSINSSTYYVIVSSSKSDVLINVRSNMKLQNVTDEIANALKIDGGQLLLQKSVARNSRSFLFTITPSISSNTIFAQIEEGKLFTFFSTPNQPSNSITIFFEQNRPQITLTSPSLSKSKSQLVGVKFKFDQPRINLTKNMIQAENASIIRIAQSSPSSYVAQFRIFKNKISKIDIKENSTTNLAKLTNLQSNSLYFEYYTIPTLSTVISSLSSTCVLLTTAMSTIFTVQMGIHNSINGQNTITTVPQRNIIGIISHVQIFALSTYLGADLPIVYREASANLRWTLPLVSLPWKSQSQRYPLLDQTNTNSNSDSNPSSNLNSNTQSAFQDEFTSPPSPPPPPSPSLLYGRGMMEEESRIYNGVSKEESNVNAYEKFNHEFEDTEGGEQDDDEEEEEEEEANGDRERQEIKGIEKDEMKYHHHHHHQYMKRKLVTVSNSSSFSPSPSPSPSPTEIQYLTSEDYQKYFVDLGEEDKNLVDSYLGKGSNSLLEIASQNYFWSFFCILALLLSYFLAKVTFQRLYVISERKVFYPLVFSRPEIFLLLVLLPGISFSSSLLVQGKVFGEILLGIIILINVPFLFLILIFLFLFLNLIIQKNVKFQYEASNTDDDNNNNNSNNNSNTYYYRVSSYFELIFGKKLKSKWVSKNEIQNQNLSNSETSESSNSSSTLSLRQRIFSPRHAIVHFGPLFQNRKGELVQEDENMSMSALMTLIGWIRSIHVAIDLTHRILIAILLGSYGIEASTSALKVKLLLTFSVLHFVIVVIFQPYISRCQQFANMFSSGCQLAMFACALSAVTGGNHAGLGKFMLSIMFIALLVLVISEFHGYYHQVLKFSLHEGGERGGGGGGDFWKGMSSMGENFLLLPLAFHTLRKRSECWRRCSDSNAMCKWKGIKSKSISDGQSSQSWSNSEHSGFTQGSQLSDMADMMEAMVERELVKKEGEEKRRRRVSPSHSDTSSMVEKSPRACCPSFHTKRINTEEVRTKPEQEVRDASTESFNRKIVSDFLNKFNVGKSKAERFSSELELELEKEKEKEKEREREREERSQPEDITASLFDSLPSSGSVRESSHGRRKLRSYAPTELSSTFKLPPPEKSKSPEIKSRSSQQSSDSDISNERDVILSIDTKLSDQTEEVVPVAAKKPWYLAWTKPKADAGDGSSRRGLVCCTAPASSDSSLSPYKNGGKASSNHIHGSSTEPASSSELKELRESVGSNDVSIPVTSSSEEKHVLENVMEGDQDNGMSVAEGDRNNRTSVAEREQDNRMNVTEGEQENRV